MEKTSSPKKRDRHQGLCVPLAAANGGCVTSGLRITSIHEQQAMIGLFHKGSSYLLKRNKK